MSETFSHLDEQNNPAMVDVGEKQHTHRSATAQALVKLPEAVRTQLSGEEIDTKKGPVFQTAILAGIMGAKRTSELIPLCHQLNLQNCKVDIRVLESDLIQITCTSKTTGQTGVEMEALTGASIAALTIYDMCKAFSHDIIIQEVKLVQKAGGKHNFEKR
ncbi:MAG: cyclic pyranopterin monophosphate synthase MoaC [Saprospiraceae bacterium]|nr:cyclic pyranopterin monophosphate synthase MoaC [Saprospiraceae bacterium]